MNFPSNFPTMTVPASRLLVVIQKTESVATYEQCVEKVSDNTRVCEKGREMIEILSKCRTLDLCHHVKARKCSTCKILFELTNGPYFAGSFFFVSLRHINRLLRPDICHSRDRVALRKSRLHLSLLLVAMGPNDESMTTVLSCPNHFFHACLPCNC